jgi:DNA-binding NarL/FixJ family response regulator
VTRPAWGEPKPRIDVRPGERRRFYGREALAYVRSRKDSSDYTRMARQRCFLSAMADQIDPLRVISHFGSLARTIEANVHTDIPLNRLPSLVKLVGSVDQKETLTVTFGPAYFFARPARDCEAVVLICAPPKEGMSALGRRSIMKSAHPASSKGLRQMGTVKVLVADDHRLMLAAVRRALMDAEGFEIVGEVSIGSQVVPAVRETAPDIVLLDLRMPELDGLACLERLRKQDPAVAVVILSSYSDPEQIEAARVAGARAYVVKTVEPVDLAGVLRAALSGSTFAVWGADDPSASRPQAAATAGLSDREGAVLAAVARGLSNREIGRQLWISEQTVKFHLRNVYRKLGISSRTEAARYAHRMGIVAALTVETA